MTHPRNIVGPKIRAIRQKQGLTQPMLVAKCHLLGWDISRETLAKVEAQIRWVADCEMLCIAKALNTSVSALLPDQDDAANAMRNFFKWQRKS
jgi:transcriptional regulator with XRE-family HTH domain